MAVPSTSSLQTVEDKANDTVVSDSETNCSRPMAESEIDNCRLEPTPTTNHIMKPLMRCNKKTITKRKASLDASEATSSYSSTSSSQHKAKGKGIACKRRNPRVPVRRTRSGFAAIGLPLGMSFAAVMAQVLYRTDAATESMSPCQLSLMCTSAIKESLANVFGDKLEGLTRNFEQSFGSTLSTLRLIYESSRTNEGNKFNNMRMEIPSSKLTLDKGDCSSDVAALHAEIQDQSISCEEVRENFRMDSVRHHVDTVSRALTLHGQSNQMVSISPSSSGSIINNPVISVYEKSIVEQRRSNELKTLELGLTMKKLKLKETQLALNFDLNDLERTKLAMGISKASFKAEKFKNQLEDMRHGELNKKCIDCLIAGLLVMSSSLLYGAYVYSYERISEATESCTPSTQESFSWWTPKSVAFINSRLNVLWCQVQVMSRMLFGVLMILAIAYLLIQRSTTSSKSMPVTFILLLLGVGCGYCGKLCVDTLGGNGYLWLLYWEILCLLHFLSIGCTSTLYSILHGPVTALQTTKESTIFRYWIRRFLFYATLLVFLPLFCGLMPFASLGQWKDHFLLKVLDFDGSE